MGIFLKFWLVLPVLNAFTVLSSAVETNQNFSVLTSESSFTLSWTSNLELAGSVEQWKVYVDGSKVREVQGTRFAQDGSETFDGYKAGQQYSVSVKFERSAGEEIVFNDEVTLNPKPVTQLHLKNHGPPNRKELLGAVSLEWTPAEGSSQDAYKVQYSSMIKEPTGQWSEGEHSEIPFVTLTGLVPGNRYRFQVKAISRGRYSRATIIDESIYPGYAEHLWVDRKQSGPTYFTLYASAPEGIVSSWAITYWRIDNDCCWNYLRNVNMQLDSENNYHTTIYKEILAGYSYRIKARAQGVHGTGDDDLNLGAEREIVYTAEPFVNSSISVTKPPTETSVELRYTPTEAYFDYYLIEVVQEGEDCEKDDCPSIMKRRNDANYAVVFTGLKPGTNYRAQLFTVAGNDRQHSENAILFSFKTAGESSTTDNTMLPVIIVLAVALLLLILATITFLVIKKRRREGTKQKKDSNSSAGLSDTNRTAHKFRSVQPVPPVPRGELPVVPPLARRATSEENDYLEIVSEPENTGYLQPVQRIISTDSDDYDKPYQQLQAKQDMESNTTAANKIQVKEDTQSIDL